MAATHLSQALLLEAKLIWGFPHIVETCFASVLGVRLRIGLSAPYFS